MLITNLTCNMYEKICIQYKLLLSILGTISRNPFHRCTENVLLLVKKLSNSSFRYEDLRRLLGRLVYPSVKPGQRWTLLDRSPVLGVDVYQDTQGPIGVGSRGRGRK